MDERDLGTRAPTALGGTHRVVCPDCAGPVHLLFCECKACGRNCLRECEEAERVAREESERRAGVLRDEVRAAVRGRPLVHWWPPGTTTGCGLDPHQTIATHEKRLAKITCPTCRAALRDRRG